MDRQFRSATRLSPTDTRDPEVGDDAVVTVLRPVFPAKLRRGDTVRVIAPAWNRPKVAEHDHSADRGPVRRARAAVDVRAAHRRAGRLRLIARRVPARRPARRLRRPRGRGRADRHRRLLQQRAAAAHGLGPDRGQPQGLLRLLRHHRAAGRDARPHRPGDLLRPALVDVRHARPLRPDAALVHEALFADQPIRLRPSPIWTDDLWFLDQDDWQPRPNDGCWPLRTGTATGRIVGGNLCSLNLLQGTGAMPSLDGAVLLVEDDATSDPPTFARDLASLLQLPDAAGIRGMAIGRFQQASGMTRHLLEQIVLRQDRLADVPVLANADFGHTNPLATIPIGGEIALTVGPTSGITITAH